VVWLPNVSVNVPLVAVYVSVCTSSAAVPAVMSARSPNSFVKVTRMPVPAPEHAATPELKTTTASVTLDSATSAERTVAALAPKPMAPVVWLLAVSVNVPVVAVQVAVWISSVCVAEHVAVCTPSVCSVSPFSTAAAGRSPMLRGLVSVMTVPAAEQAALPAL